MTLLQLVTAAAGGVPVTGTFVTSHDLFQIAGKNPLVGGSQNEAFVLKLVYQDQQFVFDLKSSAYHLRLQGLAPETVPRRTLRLVSYALNRHTLRHECRFEWTAAYGPTYDAFTITLSFDEGPKPRTGTFRLAITVPDRFPCWKKQLLYPEGIILRTARKSRRPK